MDSPVSVADSFGSTPAPSLPPTLDDYQDLFSMVTLSPRAAARQHKQKLEKAKNPSRLVDKDASAGLDVLLQYSPPDSLESTAIAHDTVENEVQRGTVAEDSDSDDGNDDDDDDCDHDHSHDHVIRAEIIATPSPSRKHDQPAQQQPTRQPVNDPDKFERIEQVISEYKKAKAEAEKFINPQQQRQQQQPQQQQKGNMTSTRGSRSNAKSNAATNSARRHGGEGYDQKEMAFPGLEADQGLDSAMQVLCAALKVQLHGEFEKAKEKLRQDQAKELQREREAHAQELRAARQEIDALRSLAQTYEATIEKKDKIIHNLTDSLATQREKLSTQQKMDRWKYQTSEKKREAFTEKMAHKYHARQTAIKSFRAWRSVIENKWRHRIEKSCKAQAEAVCVELSSEYHATIRKLRGQLAEAKEEVALLHSEHSYKQELMKQAFMRGVSALQMEALEVLDNPAQCSQLHTQRDQSTTEGHCYGASRVGNASLEEDGDDLVSSIPRAHQPQPTHTRATNMHTAYNKQRKSPNATRQVSFSSSHGYRSDTAEANRGVRRGDAGHRGLDEGKPSTLYDTKGVATGAVTATRHQPPYADAGKKRAGSSFENPVQYAIHTRNTPITVTRHTPGLKYVS